MTLIKEVNSETAHKQAYHEALKHSILQLPLLPSPPRTPLVVVLITT